MKKSKAVRKKVRAKPDLIDEGIIEVSSSYEDVLDKILEIPAIPGYLVENGKIVLLQEGFVAPCALGFCVQLQRPEGVSDVVWSRVLNHPRVREKFRTAESGCEALNAAQEELART